jgi:thiamine-monophosphate kinase
MRTKRADSLDVADSSRAGGRGELALIEQIRGRTAKMFRAGVRLGIGDDCALLRLRTGEEMAVTTDLSIADRHFRLDWHPPETIGHRALARGLSDLAAMGGRPIAAFLSLGLPPELTRTAARKQSWSSSWIGRFYDGLLALADAHNTPLAGGDLAESPLAVADIVLVGAVPRGKALLRSGAKPGNLLYVTGMLGGAASGLARLAELAAISGTAQSQPLPKRLLKIPKKLAPLLAPHLYPQPRIAQGLWLRRRGLATAAIDLSDGLSTDLAHLCQESGVAAQVDSKLLPIHSGATLAQALHGGEDYELLFSAPQSTRLPRAIAGVPITLIGRIVRRSKSRPLVTLLTAQGKQPLEPHGWQHFS